MSSIVAVTNTKEGGPCDRCQDYIEPGGVIVKVDVGYRGRQTSSGNGRGAWWCKRCANKVFNLDPPPPTMRVRKRSFPKRPPPPPPPMRVRKRSISAEGISLRNEGMGLAMGKANDLWKKAFLAKVSELAQTGVVFTSEDVTDHVGLPHGKPGQHRNNAVGAMMAAASKKGLIRKTGTHGVSRRSRSHAAEITEWVGVP